MRKAYIIYRCCKCKHAFATRKRKRKHRCSRCGIEETKNRKFQKWTIDSLLVLIDYYDKEPRSIEVMKAAQTIEAAEARGEVVKIGKKQVKKKTTRSQDPVKKIRNKSKEKSYDYQYCYYGIRGCVNPQKKLNEDGSCIMKNSRDKCLIKK